MVDTSDWTITGLSELVPSIRSLGEHPFVSSIMPLDYNAPTTVTLVPIRPPTIDSSQVTAPRLRRLEFPGGRPKP
jgi:hypothetical protein